MDFESSSLASCTTLETENERVSPVSKRHLFEFRAELSQIEHRGCRTIRPLLPCRTLALGRRQVYIRQIRIPRQFTRVCQHGALQSTNTKMGHCAHHTHSSSNACSALFLATVLGWMLAHRVRYKGFPDQPINLRIIFAFTFACALGCVVAVSIATEVWRRHYRSGRKQNRQPSLHFRAQRCPLNLPPHAFTDSSPTPQPISTGQNEIPAQMRLKPNFDASTLDTKAQYSPTVGNAKPRTQDSMRW